MIKIWVSGSLAYDRVMDFSGRFAEHINPKKIHVINLSFAVEKLNLSYGGTAGNIAYNLRLLGAPTAVVANLGKDGDDYRLRLKAMKIDTRALQTVPDKFTAGAYIITDLADNQIAGFDSGAMSAHSVLPKVRRGDWAIISADAVANMMRLSLYYQKRGTRYIFDPGQQSPLLSGSYLRQAMKHAYVIVGNDYETDMMLRRSGFRPADEQILVTTLGARGSVLLSRGRKIIIPSAKPGRVVDPTGAGDAYRAGLIFGLISRYPLEKAGRLASCVAVHAVEKYGTQNHRFTWNSLKSRFIENFKYPL